MSAGTAPARHPPPRRRGLPLRACGGTAVIEFAMLLPVFLLLFLGVIEFGRMMWMQASLQASVETAARCLALGSSISPCNSSAQTTVDDQMANYGYAVTQPTVSASTPGCGSQVSATLQFTFIAQGLFPWSPTLSALSCYP